MSEQIKKELWAKWLKQFQAYNAKNLSSKERRDLYEKN